MEHGSLRLGRFPPDYCGVPFIRFRPLKEVLPLGLAEIVAFKQFLLKVSQRIGDERAQFFAKNSGQRLMNLSMKHTHALSRTLLGRPPRFFWIMEV